MLKYKYDTQLMVETEKAVDEIKEYLSKNIEGDCLLVIDVEPNVAKIHMHTNAPWKVLEYANSLGDMQTIIIENLQRQTEGLNG